jgi:polyhydroxybutyrate depolymerase
MRVLSPLFATSLLLATGALGACGKGGSSGAGTGEGCPTPGGFPAGERTLTLQHDGVTREYIVHVPASYDGSRPVPLVFDIHGLTSNAGQQAALTGWGAKADREGFIVVWPNGLDSSWNGGSLCCGTSQANQVDDEGFIRAVVTRMRGDACIDAKRVYVTGLSNGGAMSHLLACRAADVFAASAPVSMGNGTIPCAPSRPIPVVMFRGTTDPLVPYDGGLLFPSAAADFSQWQTLDGCTGPPETTHGVCQRVATCNAGVEVTLCTIDAGHVLYAAAAAQGAPVPDVAWEAFQRYALP